MVGPGAGAELLQGFWFYFCMADVDDDVEAFPQMIGTLHNHVQCPDDLGGHTTLGGYLGLAAIEVNADQYSKFVVQWNPSPPRVAATVQTGPQPRQVDVIYATHGIALDLDVALDLRRS